MKKHKAAFTLIELLVVIAIISLLAAILFPVFGRAREMARRSSCQSNLKQVGLGFQQYTQDYDEKYPAIPGAANDISLGQIKHWPYALQPYIKSAQVFKCPSDRLKIASSYTASNYVSQKSTAIVPEASKYVLAMDGTSSSDSDTSKATTNTSSGNGLNADYTIYCQRYRVSNKDHGTPRHMGRSNFLYYDGHVKISPQIPEHSTVVPSVAELESAIPFTTYIWPTPADQGGCATGWN